VKFIPVQYYNLAFWTALQMPPGRGWGTKTLSGLTTLTGFGTNRPVSVCSTWQRL